MKITAEHIEHMRAAIVPVLPRLPTVEQYRGMAGVKDPAKRRRWDAARAAGLITWMCDTLYPYANDEHIDSALRAIVS